MSAPCAIWNSRTYDSGKVGDRFQYDAPRTGGKYEITRTAKVTLDQLSDHERARLTSWLIEQRRAGIACPLITNEIVEQAQSLASKTIRERRDGLLEVVSNHTPSLGETMEYIERFAAMARAESDYENPHWAEHDVLLAATESVKISEVEKLISFASNQGLLSDSGGLSLTFEGHTYLEELSAHPGNSYQAFVAMWFNEEMTAAYESGIAPAIADAGYRPFRIDRKEHNNKIDDEIIAEIRRSRFLVADFTCGIATAGEEEIAISRGGVYYEAGFAQGLNMPVIWMCREDHINHVHFDTRQFNHITWKSPDDLRERLTNRINAVLGDGPLNAT